MTTTTSPSGSPSPELGALSRCRSALVIILSLMLASGCQDEKESEMIERVLGSASATAKPEPTIPTWEKMPSITVDELGIYIGGRRADPNKAKDKDKEIKKLAQLVDNLPIDKGKPKPVIVIAQKKAQTADVAELVYQLGRAGFAEVVVRTEGRPELFKTADGKSLPMELTVVPESRIDKPNPCSVVAMTSTDGSTKVWSFKGGGSLRQKGGFAGPDLTRTGEVISKKMLTCDSSLAIFSADPTMEWKYAFNMGSLIKHVDEKSQIRSLVITADPVVAGQPVKLRE